MYEEGTPQSLDKNLLTTKVKVRFKPGFVAGPRVVGVEMARSYVGFNGDEILIRCWVLEC